MNDIIIKDTHRGLWYEDGVLTRILEAGRYVFPKPRLLPQIFGRVPKVEVVLVDVRERDLTIKGQEILTADKVAIRVSIIVQFRVTDPRAALHQVEKYEDRLYSDVQLAARRSLASMPLEEILTNRNQLSEDILRDVKEIAATYGVAIFRADVKDLIFPGNLQEIMNKVLAAERMSEAQLVEARTKADVQRIEAQAKTETQRLQADALAQAQRLAAHRGGGNAGGPNAGRGGRPARPGPGRAGVYDSPGPAAPAGTGNAARAGEVRPGPHLHWLRQAQPIEGGDVKKAAADS